MIDSIGGIIWDWNGTLLNDIELCVETMNGMLLKRGLSPLTISGYKEVFSFPVENYYRKIGFDFGKEPFEIPALEFIAEYNSHVANCSLHSNSESVLRYFKSLGIRQFVLSATKQDALDKCLEQQNISQFFEHISGLDNHFAASKLENGRQLISALKLNPKDLVFIGDTVHDYEVATELGCRCVLVANGHQSRKLLENTGAFVIDELIHLIG